LINFLEAKLYSTGSICVKRKDLEEGRNVSIYTSPTALNHPSVHAASYLFPMIQSIMVIMSMSPVRYVPSLPSSPLSPPHSLLPFLPRKNSLVLHARAPASIPGIEVGFLVRLYLSKNEFYGKKEEG